MKECKRCQSESTTDVGLFIKDEKCYSLYVCFVCNDKFLCETSLPEEGFFDKLLEDIDVEKLKNNSKHLSEALESLAKVNFDEMKGEIPETFYALKRTLVEVNKDIELFIDKV